MFETVLCGIGIIFGGPAFGCLLADIFFLDFHLFPSVPGGGGQLCENRSYIIGCRGLAGYIMQLARCAGCDARAYSSTRVQGSGVTKTQDSVWISDIVLEFTGAVPGGPTRSRVRGWDEINAS